MFQAQPMGRFACQLRPRFDVACQNSSAAAPQTTAITAGTFISVTFMSGRLPSASEIHTTPIRGNGTAASIRARIRVNISPTPPRPSPRPAPISNANGGRSCRNAPSPIFRHARSERLDCAEICAVGYRQGDLNRQLWTGETAHRFRKCPCGEIFDMHGPEAVLVHVPHISAAEHA
jgi:hypothetical protein